MLQFYFHPSPNPMKVALMLGELGLPFETVAVDIFKGEQHEPGFRRLNPNGKVPVIVDDGVTVFDSHAILLYLAEKHQRFLPSNPRARAATLSWLQFVATGLSPFSGQAVHFLHYAPEPLPYAKNRYLKEVERHYQVLETRLSEARFLGGDEYSIADMALWGWARGAAYIFGDKALTAYPKVQQLVQTLTQRPAAQKAAELAKPLKLKTDFDEQTRRALFPQNL
ncbi:MAG TPA: glutathione S-transferase N-terminal domain-containing protein [Polyangiaceae bacterium]|nr:glutathione S-transferase N-terminal domain-containing protein [Polyangiaceae bacterium]